MKILQIVPHVGAESSGPSYSVPGLCRGLAKNGVETELCFLGEVPERLKGEVYRSVSYPQHDKLNLGRSPEMLMRLRDACKTADIIHSNSLWMMPNVYPAWAVKGTACKLVVAPRGTLAAWSLKKGWLKKKIFGWLLQNQVLRRADMFHATSEKEYEEIRALGYKQPVAIVPIGMDVPERRRDQVKGSGIRGEKGRLHRVVFFGRLHKVKAIDRLIQAWELLTKDEIPLHCRPISSTSTSLPPWELVIAGPDGGVRAELESYIADHKIPRIRFVGEINGPAKYDFLSSADLYVLPSHTENFAVTVAEALACGTPVIVSKGTPWSGVEGEDEGRGARSRSTVEFVDLAPGDTFDQIEQYLRQRVLVTFENKVLGISASIGSKRNANELAKHMAAGESPEVHKFAAKNIGALFERGVVGFTHLDKKATPNQRWITQFVRVVSSFYFGGERFVATLTLKAESAGGRLYAVEAVEINQDAKLRSTPRGAISKDLNSAPILNLTSQLAVRIAYYVGDVNRTHPAFLGRSEPFSIERATELIRERLDLGALASTEKTEFHRCRPRILTSTSSRCGWWVDNDPETLAKTLREAMSLSDEERRQMGEVGRDWIRRDFSWSAVGAKMKAAYEWLLNGGERPEYVKIA